MVDKKFKFKVVSVNIIFDYGVEYARVTLKDEEENGLCFDTYKFPCLYMVGQFYDLEMTLAAETNNDKERSN